MKKFLPLALLAGLLAVTALSRPAVAEDPKPDEDLFDNTSYGFKIWKPKGNKLWKFVGEGAWDKDFSDSGVFQLNKWGSETADPQKDRPLVSMYAFRYDTQGKFKIGTWEGSPNSTKGFAKAIFEVFMEKEFKNPKNVSETDKATYPCGKMYQFSCYAEHKKYGGAFYVRVMVCKGEGGNTYDMRINCAPGEEKKAGQEIETILRSIRFYDKK